MLVRLGPLLQLGNVFIEIPCSSVALFQTPFLKVRVVALEQFFVRGPDVLHEGGASHAANDTAIDRQKLFQT